MTTTTEGALPSLGGATVLYHRTIDDHEERAYLWASTLGTAGWTAMLAFAGFKLGENFEDINALLGPASNAVLVVLGIGYLYRVWTHRDIDPDESEPGLPLL